MKNSNNKPKIILHLVIALAVTAVLNSCGINYAVTGNYNLNATQVQLSNNNFHVVDTLSGSASVSYILLIGGLGEHQLYENAYFNMIKKADLKSGSRAIANVVTEEQVAGFVPIYFTRTVTVSANIIEFTK